MLGRPKDLRLRRQRKVHQQVVETFHRTCHNLQLGYGNSVLEEMEAAPGGDTVCDIVISAQQLQEATDVPW
jgi:hypothetical protein